MRDLGSDIAHPLVKYRDHKKALALPETSKHMFLNRPVLQQPQLRWSSRNLHHPGIHPSHVSIEIGLEESVPVSPTPLWSESRLPRD